MKNRFISRNVPALLAILFTLIPISTHAGLFGSKHVREYKKQRDAAKKLLDGGKSQEALDAYQAAHQILEKSGKKDSYLEASFKDLGRFYVMHGLTHKAEPYFGKYVAAVKARRGTNHVETARALYIHGQTLQRLHRFTEAEKSLLRAEYTARWKMGRYSVSAGYCKAVLGQLYLHMNRNEEAAKYLSEGLKQMGKFKRTTRFVEEDSSFRRREEQSVFKPDPEETSEVMADYAAALLRLNRTPEAEKIMSEARTLMITKMKYPLAEYFIQRRIAVAAESIGDLKTAEKHFYAAAQATYANQAATDAQKLKANKMLYAFHIRYNQQIKASTQESILFSKKVPEGEINWVVHVNEQLAAAREKK